MHPGYRVMIASLIIENGTQEIKSWTEEELLEIEAEYNKEEAEIRSRKNIPVMTTEFKMSLIREAKRIVEEGEVMNFIADTMRLTTYGTK